MFQECDIYFLNWEMFENDHTQFVKASVNRKEIEETKDYLVDMVNELKRSKDSVIKVTIYPQTDIMKKDYAEFHFQFEFETEVPRVIYLGCDVTEEE